MGGRRGGRAPGVVWREVLVRKQLGGPSGPPSTCHSIMGRDRVCRMCRDDSRASVDASRIYQVTSRVLVNDLPSGSPSGHTAVFGFDVSILRSWPSRRRFWLRSLVSSVSRTMACLPFVDVPVRDFVRASRSPRTAEPPGSRVKQRPCLTAATRSSPLAVDGRALPPGVRRQVPRRGEAPVVGRSTSMHAVVAASIRSASPRAVGSSSAGTSQIRIVPSREPLAMCDASCQLTK